MASRAIETWFFAVVAVRQGRRLLLVQERKHGQTWYLPAGHVEPDEGVLDAARRETLEEAGIRIEVDGVVRVEFGRISDGLRVRAVLTGHQVDDAAPKSVPDEESLRAGWFTLEEARRLDLRGDEVLELFAYLEGGGTVAPVSALVDEGAPYPRRG